jgi:glutamate-ammonia-ligase adenylyltransferase
MKPVPTLPTANVSRFVKRWLDASPARAVELATLSELSLDQLDFDQLLSEQLAGASLSGAMRQLRNLLVAAIAQRDISGKAHLNEVLTAIVAIWRTCTVRCVPHMACRPEKTPVAPSR